MTTVSASSPARTQARALSYSQLVPGKTGMTTRGLAIFVFAKTGAFAGPLAAARQGASAVSTVQVG